MASSSEDVILDLDNATDDVRITTPPPPYLPSLSHTNALSPLHSESLPPSYPPSPPPEYGQLVTDNAYTASKAIELPRLKKTSQANPPPPPMLPPSSQATYAQSQLQPVGSQRLRIGSRQGNMPYLSYLVFSCCVVCSCGIFCGMTAFVLGCKSLLIHPLLQSP